MQKNIRDLSNLEQIALCVEAIQKSTVEKFLNPIVQDLQNYHMIRDSFIKRQEGRMSLNSPYKDTWIFMDFRTLDT